MDEFYAALPQLDFSRPQEQPQSQPQFQPPPAAPPVTALPPDPSIAQTDPEEWRRQFDAYNRSVVSSILEQAASTYSKPLIDSQAQTARELSRRDPRNAEIWQRFGPEVDREIAKLPMQHRTKSAYDMACDLVRGRRFDAIVAARSATAPNSTATATPTAPPSKGPIDPTPVDQLWDSNHFYVERLKRSGVNKTSLREKIRAMGLTEKQWVEGLTSGSLIITDDDKRQRVSAGAS